MTAMSICAWSDSKGRELTAERLEIGRILAGGAFAVHPGPMPVAPDGDVLEALIESAVLQVPG